MFTSNDSDDFWSHDNCGCGYCDEYSETYDDGDGVYDDPYEVVMYDITTEDDDLIVLIDMLGDSARSWYAKRRINAMAAAGPLSALVADIIIDSLGRRWDPLQHPRDRFGRFINTGGFLRWLATDGGWLRGQVSRIDSDGNIHVRSAGNDKIPDGTVYRFKPEFASKLVSTKAPVADLTPLDFDADIPDFPEASDIQKQIYNHLGDGDMPVVDLDRAVGDIDLSAEDFAGELQGLVERDLISVDKSGDKPRASRNDNDDLGVVNVGDDEIVDVPDDETPELEDSPAFTKEQRDLLDRMVEADAGEGDGVTVDELGEHDEVALRGLINDGAIDEDDDGRLHLVNPETDEGQDVGGEAPETDISTEIFDAAAGISDDPDVQEAFQHYAEELARPGDEANIPLNEDLAPAKRRNAEAAANKWWAERNGVTPDGADETAVTDAPEAGQPNPKDALNPRNQALADQRVAEFFPDDEFLDSKVGEELRGAVKRLFDAEDLEENGFDVQAAAERDKADRAMRRIEVPEDEIPGWHEDVRNVRDGNLSDPGLEEDAPELPEETPEPDVLEEPEVNEDELIPLSLPGDDFEVDEAVLDQREADDFADEDVPEPEPEAPEEALPEPEAAPEAEELAVEEVDLPSEEDLAEAGVEDAAPVEVPEEDAERILAEEEEVVPDPEAEVEPEVEPEAKAPRNAPLYPGRNQFQPEDIPLLFEDAWDTSEQAEAAQGVAQAMWDAQNGMLRLDDAYEVAASKVERGQLTQNDLDRIQDSVRQHLEGRGQKWVGAYAIDHVGDDQRAVDVDAPDVDAPDVDVPEDLPEASVPEAMQQALFEVGEADLVPAVSNPAYVKVSEQPDFLENKPDIEREGEVLDRNGQRVQLGGWYKANAGGEGDPDQVIGFLRQDRYPGWVLVQAPDGKLKAVNARGKGRGAGLNRMPDPGTEQRAQIRVQRAVGGKELLELDQNNPKNVLFGGVRAEVGMRVGGRGDAGQFREGDEGVIVRIGWNAGQNRPNIFVIKPGAQGQGDEMQLAPRRLVPILEGTPEPPTPDLPTPEPEAPNLRTGAESPLEVDILNALDGADSQGLLRSQLVMLDDDNALERLNALGAMVDRGVLEQFEGDDGKSRYRKVDAAAPDSGFANGAQNEVEADLLGIIDVAGDNGAIGADLIDIDADDAPEKMAALRELVNRRVLRRVIDPDSGKPVYRRPQTGSGSSPVSMSNEEAARAIKSGADPVLVATDNLESVMRDAGYSFSLNGQAGISQDNFWAVAPQNGPFPVNIRSNGGVRSVAGRTYMVKRSSGSPILPNDVLNEVMAGALSEDVKDRAGADAPGLLHHPRVALASAPKGLGSRAGGAIVMDHAAYGFPEGHILHGGLGVTSGQLFDGDASEGVIGLALYDFVIGNTKDRHRQNQMYIEDPNTGKIQTIIIDNGYAFGAAGERESLGFREYAGMSRPSGLLGRARARQMGRERVQAAVQQFVDTYKQMDVDAMMDRIRALFPAMTPDQEAYARQHLTVSKNRVDSMSTNIGNIVDIIMNV